MKIDSTTTFYGVCYTSALAEFADDSYETISEKLAAVKKALMDMDVRAKFKASNQITPAFKQAYCIKTAHKQALRELLRLKYKTTQLGRLTGALKTQGELAKKCLELLNGSLTSETVDELRTVMGSIAGMEVKNAD